MGTGNITPEAMKTVPIVETKPELGLKDEINQLKKQMKALSTPSKGGKGKSKKGNSADVDTANAEVHVRKPKQDKTQRKFFNLPSEWGTSRETRKYPCWRCGEFGHPVVGTNCEWNPERVHQRAMEASGDRSAHPTAESDAAEADAKN